MEPLSNFTTERLPELLDYERRRLETPNMVNRLIMKKLPQHVEATLANYKADAETCWSFIEQNGTNNGWTTFEDTFQKCPQSIQGALLARMPDWCFTEFKYSFLNDLIKHCIHARIPCRPATYPFFFWYMIYNPSKFAAMRRDGYVITDPTIYALFETLQEEPPPYRRRRRDWQKRTKQVRCNSCLNITPQLKRVACIHNGQFKKFTPTVKTAFLFATHHPLFFQSAAHDHEHIISKQREE